jgi:hypothetical protein
MKEEKIKKIIRLTPKGKGCMILEFKDETMMPTKIEYWWRYKDGWKKNYDSDSR